MKNLKFRAWDGEKMLSQSDLYWDGQRFTIGAWDARKRHLTGFVREPKVMQYTGLNDRAGREIYEGDIVSLGDGEPGVVMFNCDNFAGLPAFHICDFDGKPTDYYGAVADDSHRVIGNVYENPELMREIKNDKRN